MGSDERNNPDNAERRAIARELAKSARLVDRFGRPILERCGYTVNMLQPPIYTVDEIIPVLDRVDVPRGSFRVRMTAHMTLICSNGVPVDELALCSMSQEVMQTLGGAGVGSGTVEPPHPPPATMDSLPDPPPPLAGIHLVTGPTDTQPAAKAEAEQPAPPAAPEES